MLYKLFSTKVNHCYVHCYIGRKEGKQVLHVTRMANRLVHCKVWQILSFYCWECNSIPLHYEHIHLQSYASHSTEGLALRKSKLRQLYGLPCPSRACPDNPVPLLHLLFSIWWVCPKHTVDV